MEQGQQVDWSLATKKNILHKKLKKRAPNNLRPNKVDKNSASAIL
ncbi:18913_t:CDS:2, partial [Gigaspora margarita]